MIEDRSQEPPLYQRERLSRYDDHEKNEAAMDLETMLDEMANERYVTVIKRLVLDDESPEDVAEEMGVTVANLYNIKKRAIAALTEIAIDKRM